MGMNMYSASSIRDMRYMFLISKHAYFAPGVEMTLLRCNLIVDKSAVGWDLS